MKDETESQKKTYPEPLQDYKHGETITVTTRFDITVEATLLKSLPDHECVDTFGLPREAPETSPQYTCEGLLENDPFVQYFGRTGRSFSIDEEQNWQLEFIIHPRETITETLEEADGLRRWVAGVAQQYGDYPEPIRDHENSDIYLAPPRRGSDQIVVRLTWDDAGPKP